MTQRIFVAGHRGMVGSAIVRALEDSGSDVDIITCNRDALDLTDQSAVREFFSKVSVDQVYLAAAKVGGIYANQTYPAEFIYENVIIEANVVEAAFRSGVKKLLFLGSSCIYPKLAEQPISESSLLTGPLEPTNEPYAVAKIVGIKLCESYNRQYGESHGVDYRSVMPTNLYGPGDNYHPENSHVIPALIRRFHEAKINNLPAVKIWGTGIPRREFLYVDDMARASLHVMNLDKTIYDRCTDQRCSHINVGSGQDLAILELAEKIKNVVGYKGNITLDLTKPDGSPRKLINSSRLNELGWYPQVDLGDGLAKTYAHYLG